MNRWILLFCILAISGLLISCSGTKTLTADEYNQLGPDERITYLETQTQKNPEDLPLKRQLYTEYLNADRVPAAMRVMEQIFQQDPYQVDVIFEYGKLQYQSGDYQSAYRAWRDVLQSTSGELYKDQIGSYVAGGFLVQQITSDPADEGFPSFSPDGSKVIFQKMVGDNWDILEYELATQNTTVLVSTPADEELPAYDPNGSRVVFASNANDRRPVDSRFKVREIAEIHLSDRYTANLTQSVADDWLPRYNSNGSQILFVSERDDLRSVGYTEKQSDIFLMESDGDFQLPLTKTAFSEGGATFSADDRKVFYHSDRNGNFDVFVMKLDGSQQMTVVDNTYGDDINPAASPDSTKIAFVSNRDGNYEIYTAALNGADQTRLTFSPATDNNPSFSPDGRTVVFHSDRNGNYDIFLVNLDYPTETMSLTDLQDRLNQLIN